MGGVWVASGVAVVVLLPFGLSKCFASQTHEQQGTAPTAAPESVISSGSLSSGFAAAAGSGDAVAAAPAAAKSADPTCKDDGLDDIRGILTASLLQSYLPTYP